MDFADRGVMGDFEDLIPKDAGLFGAIMASEVVAVVCRRCGTETVMNKKYARYLEGGSIVDCGLCRNSVRP